MSVGWRVAALLGSALLAGTASAQDTDALGAGVDGGVVIIAPRLLRPVTVSWPREPFTDGGAGVVQLLLELSVEGVVVRAEVVSAPSQASGDAALHAAPSLEFSPATLGGAPTAVRLVMDFALPVAAAPAAALAPPRGWVEGVVRSRGTRAPLSFASLAVDDGGVVEADGDGRFSLALEPGAHAVSVRAAGFVEATFTEAVDAGLAIEVVYGLTPTSLVRFETVVRGQREAVGERRVELRGAEVKEVPGTLGDPFRVVMLLPGVSAVLSGVGWPVVRGSSPASTGYFLDGVRVPQLYHVFLGPAVVHPDFIEGVDFFPGGAPVRYGRLLGGVIEGKLAKSTSTELHATAYADLLNAGAFVDVPLAATKTRVTLAGRLGYSALLVGPLSNALQGPEKGTLVADYGDYQARVEQALPFGEARVFAFGSVDGFGTVFDDPALDSKLQRVTFHRVDGRVRARLPRGELDVGLTLGADVFGFDLRGRLVEDLEFPGIVCAGSCPLPPLVLKHQTSTITQDTVSPRLEWRGALSDAWSASAGASWERVAASFSQTIEVTPEGGPTVSDAQASPVALASLFAEWAEARWTGPAGLAATLGLRSDQFHLVPEVYRTTVDPRASATWAVSDRLQLRANAGLFHQAPTFLIALPVVDVASLRAGVQEGVQSSVGATWRTLRDLELSVDLYVNPLLRSIELGIFDDERIDYRRPIKASNDTPGEFIPPAAEARRGVAAGVDLMARLPTSGRWFGWATLSVSRATRQTVYTVYLPNGRKGGALEADLPSAFDQTLVANAVLSYRFDSGWTVGGVAHVNTGHPESGQLGSRTKVPGLKTSGEPTGDWARVTRDAVDRLPPYFRLDLRVSKKWVFDTFLLEAWFDALNVTVNGEVTGYGYEKDKAGNLVKRTNAIPVVLPNLGVKGSY